MFGEIQFLKTPQTRFAIQGSNLPGDTLALLYGAKLPPEILLGAGAVRGTIAGAGTDIYTNLRIDAPGATYPLSTDLQINPQGLVALRDGAVIVAGGKVLVTGKFTNTNWLVNLQPQNLDTQKLAKLASIRLDSNYGGKLDGNIQVGGRVHAN